MNRKTLDEVTCKLSRMKVRMARSRKQTQVNWAELSADVLRIISKKLCDIWSFIRFRAVCKGWRSATHVSDHSGQFPCIMHWSHMDSVPPRQFPWSRIRSTLRVYSLASRRTHTFQIQNAQFGGPSGGHVLVRFVSDWKNLSLLNPLTRVKQTLPFEVPSGLLAVCIGCNSRNEFAVVRKAGRYDDLYFKPSRRDQWSEMSSFRLESIAYYDHRFFRLGGGSYLIDVIDETTSALLSTIRFPVYTKNCSRPNYLIATTDGLLAIHVYVPYFCKDLKECQFEVHRLENYAQNPHWTKLSGIGDMILFLDNWNGFFLNANDVDGFTGNCVYFITRRRGCNWHKNKYLIGRFDMGLNQTEEISGPAWFGTKNWVSHDGFFGWFVPAL